MARRKTKKGTRKHRGGFYGAAGPIPGAGGAPAGMRWGTSQEVPTPNYVKGGRRRKTKGRKTKRGGSRFGAVSASFQGTGVNGMANYTGVTTKGGSGNYAYGAFNDNGAKPGSSFK